MSTSQPIRIRTSGASSTQSWSTVFQSQVTSKQESLLFVKKLVAIIVSSVTYVRGIFPENVFEDRELDGINLKILLADSKVDSLKAFVQSFDGVFEALEKGYLDELSLVFYDRKDSPEYVQETYTMKFSYAPDGTFALDKLEAATPKKSNLLDLQGSTKRLLHSVLCLTQTLEPLPESTVVGLQISFKEEVTPLEYEATGFAPTEIPIFSESSVSVKVGQIQTAHHRVRFKFRSNEKVLENVEIRNCEEVAKDFSPDSGSTHSSHLPRNLGWSTPCVDGLEQSTAEYESRTLSTKLPPISNDTCDCEKRSRTSQEDPLTPSEPKLKRRRKFEIFPKNSTEMERNEDSGGKGHTDWEESPLRTPKGSQLNVAVRCPCGLQDFDRYMLICSICSYFQHAVCFRVTRAEDLKRAHLCYLCELNGLGMCTDPFLKSCLGNEEALKETCLYRRTLDYLCDQTPSLCYTVSTLAHNMGVSRRSARRLFFLLQVDGVFHLKSSDGGNMVDKRCLDKAIASKLFTTEEPLKEENDIRHLINAHLKTPKTSKTQPVSLSPDMFNTAKNDSTPALSQDLWGSQVSDQETRREQRETN